MECNKDILIKQNGSNKEIRFGERKAKEPRGRNEVRVWEKATKPVGTMGETFKMRERILVSQAV